MQKQVTLKLLPSESASDPVIRNYIAQALAVRIASLTGYRVQKKSIDARGKQPWVNLTLLAFIDEAPTNLLIPEVHFPDVSGARYSVVIVGAGPAGLFAALQLIQSGIRPIILERGKDVRARRRDLAAINREGMVNPESNYCFGEGGAGTYSDGKLYTRSHKRGDAERILRLLHLFGTNESILYESHPHIGTNKLPQIITAIREKIISRGGEFHFGKKVVDLEMGSGQVQAVRCSDRSRVAADAFILATGHSARDIFRLLFAKKISIIAKPFALGVRVEHPQSLIDTIQYHCQARDMFLPPASYSLVQQVEKRGVFSFCMCPGGIIAPAATNPGEIVVNGWSPSKRNNPYANSGIVTEIRSEDLRSLPDFEKVTGEKTSILESALGMMYFQQYVEQKAFQAGGGSLVAPAQRLIDFTRRKTSGNLPDCSYQPGLLPVALTDVLPGFVEESLREGFRAFGRKMKGYLTNDAVVVATESRTSSPVRIPRDPVHLHHPQLKNLFPCGEGAGYAGGIMSAAMDGEKIALAISTFARIS